MPVSGTCFQNGAGLQVFVQFKIKRMCALSSGGLAQQSKVKPKKQRQRFHCLMQNKEFLLAASSWPVQIPVCGMGNYAASELLGGGHHKDPPLGFCLFDALDAQTL